MGLIRGIVGFLTLLLAFDFRQNEVPKWHFGVVAGVSVLGALAGLGARAPHPQGRSAEEQMLIGFLLAILGIGPGRRSSLGDLSGACLLGAVVGIASTAGKLAFDSIVQRDAPDANRGRSFAKFETRFQIIWVFGALLGLIAFAPRVGFLIVSLAAGVRGLLLRHRLAGVAPPHRRQRTRATETAVVIDDRITEVQAAAKRGLRRPAGPDARAHGRAAARRRRALRRGRRGRRATAPSPTSTGPSGGPTTRRAGRAARSTTPTPSATCRRSAIRPRRRPRRPTRSSTPPPPPPGWRDATATFACGCGRQRRSARRSGLVVSPSGRSMRASQRPGASTSAGVGSMLPRSATAGPGPPRRPARPRRRRTRRRGRSGPG